MKITYSLSFSIYCLESLFICHEIKGSDENLELFLRILAADEGERAA